MEHHLRKPARRKNSAEFYDSIKPPSSEEGDKDLCLFHEDNHYKPEYLEMPIKIESNLSSSRKRNQRLHGSSNENSDHEQSEDMFSQVPDKSHLHDFFKENAKDEYDELMNPMHKMDAIDSLLLPFSDNYSYNLNDINQYLLQDSMEIKEEPIPTDYKAFSSEETFHLKNLENYQRGLLNLFNHFRSFTHATTVAMNYHKLAKKDALTKDHTSVFNLLSKEIKKLHVALEAEQDRFGFKIEEEQKRISKDRHDRHEFNVPIELISTHEGSAYDPTLELRSRDVKVEEHQNETERIQKE